MKRNIVLVLMLAIALIVAGCGGGGGGNKTTQTASISGYVADSISLVNLGNVKVEIGSVATVYTDANGFFQSGQFPVGSYTFTFSKTGYLNKSFGVLFDSTGSFQFNNPIHIADQNHTGFLPSTIQDVTINNGTATANITANNNVSMIFAIPYNTSLSSTGSISVSIIDNPGSGLDAPPQNFSTKHSTSKVSKSDVMGKFAEYQHQQITDLTRKGIVPKNADFKSPSLLSHTINESKTFYKISNFDTYTYTNVTARLKYQSNHCLIYVDTTQNINQSYIDNLGILFENTIYPRITQNFGAVDINVDGEDQIYILLTPLSGSVLGYFHGMNEYPTNESPYSNYKEMIYVTTSNYSSNPNAWVDANKGTIAHEFQHLVNFSYNDKRGNIPMNTWINEGLSMVAMDIGTSLSGTHFRPTVDDWVQSFLEYSKQISLTNWESHYGGVYLFMRYIADRFGEDKLDDIVSSPNSDYRAIENAVIGNQFSDLLRDWLTAIICETLSIDSSPVQYRINTIDLSEPQFINSFYMYAQGNHSNVDCTTGMYISRVNLQSANQITVNVSSATSGMRLRLVIIPVNDPRTFHSDTENPGISRLR